MRLPLFFAQASGIPLEFKKISLKARDNHTPEYLALNPTGQVPVLVDGETVVYESGAILRCGSVVRGLPDAPAAGERSCLALKYDSPLYPRANLAAIGAIETAYEHIRQKPWDTASGLVFEVWRLPPFSLAAASLFLNAAPVPAQTVFKSLLGVGDTNQARVSELKVKLDKQLQFLQTNFFKTNPYVGAWCTQASAHVRAPPARGRGPALACRYHSGHAPWPSSARLVHLQPGAVPQAQRLLPAHQSGRGLPHVARRPGGLVGDAQIAQCLSSKWGLARGCSR